MNRSRLKKDLSVIRARTQRWRVSQGKQNAGRICLKKSQKGLSLLWRPCLACRQVIVAIPPRKGGKGALGFCIVFCAREFEEEFQLTGLELTLGTLKFRRTENTLCGDRNRCVGVVGN